MRRGCNPRLILVTWLIVAPLAPGSPGRSHGVLAEGTRWQNRYYITDSGKKGPTVVITGGIHGNEPAGYRAAGQIRSWPIQCGKLVVIPRVNTPGIKENIRWLPGEDEATRNANRNFPRIGAPEKALTLPVQAVWEFIKGQKPDWVVDLHEGFDFYIAQSGSVGSSIIYLDDPYMRVLADKIQRAVNATITDPKRKIVKLKDGPVNGGLVRAAITHLGARGFCFETTFNHQPLSTRTRQHRIMVNRLLRELEMVSDNITVMAPRGPGRPIQVALYDSAGTGGKSVANLTRILESGTAFSVNHVGPADVKADSLSQFDLVIFPGGSGSRQARALGPRGREAVRKFIGEGGGFIGICGGAYLATAKYKWSLKIINAKTFTGMREVPGQGEKAMWIRGKGRVKMSLTESGKRIFGEMSDSFNVVYQNGPILSPHTMKNLPRYVPLAMFRSEISRYEMQKNTMVNTPAMAFAPYGKGRVMVISPHPEATKGLEGLVEQAVRYVSRRKTSLLRTFRGHLYRRCYSASCRVAMGTYPISRPRGGLTRRAGSMSASFPAAGGVR
jgi:glutamine amidotransferase-like uncharacterized protein